MISEKVTETVKRLRKLNFEHLIKLPFDDVSEYSFLKYKSNSYRHPVPSAYCVSCENKGINTCAKDASFKLTNISHGAHSLDFLQAITEDIDISEWHTEPIMFVYESPSLDYGIYDTVQFAEHAKRPSKEWYWVHGDRQYARFPSYFKGGEYGGYMLSAICTFRLSNCYMTNLLKCGMSNPQGKFVGIDGFSEDCIRNCYNEILSKEISIMEPAIIFCVGSTVERWVRHLTQNKFYIQQLPHPAGQKRGFRDDYYKTLYFWLVLKSLYKSNIVKGSEFQELTQSFVEKFE